MPLSDIFRTKWCYGRIPHGDSSYEQPFTTAEREGRFETYVTGEWEPIGPVQQGWMTVRRKRTFKEKCVSWLTESKPVEQSAPAAASPAPPPQSQIWDDPPSLADGA